jgi:hypothetical protein
MSSGMLHRVISWKLTEVSEALTVSIISYNPVGLKLGSAEPCGSMNASQMYREILMRIGVLCTFCNHIYRVSIIILNY